MENRLQESIRQAIENGQLDKMMSVFRMEAVKQQIEDEALQQMIEKEKEAFNLKREAEEAKRKAEEELKRKEEELKRQEEDVKRQMEEMRKREEEIQRKAVAAATRNKYILWGICAVAIILEWILIFRAHPAEGESHRLILTLIVNFITLLAVVICAAVFFRKHN